MCTRLAMLFVAIGCLVGCGGKSDSEAIQDSWLVVTAEEGGKPPEDPRKKTEAMLIDNDFSLFAQGSEGRLTFDMKLDPATSPKEIDLTGDGLVQPGIYELKGDELKICFDQSGKTRPTEFDTKDGDKNLLLVMKRKSK